MTITEEEEAEDLTGEVVTEETKGSRITIENCKSIRNSNILISLFH